MKLPQLLILIFIAFGSASVRADDAPLHLIDPVTGSNGPTVPDSMNKRVEQAAIDYEKYAPVPRITLSDIAVPKDVDEYRAVDGYGVILITALSQQKDELPPKRLYVRINGSEVELHLYVAGFEKQSGSAAVQQVFGKYRWDGLYYYPVYFSARAQEIVIDYAKNRAGFVIQKFGGGDKMLPDFLQSIVNPPHGDKPPADAFAKLVSREYPGFFQASSASPKN